MYGTPYINSVPRRERRSTYTPVTVSPGDFRFDVVPSAHAVTVPDMIGIACNGENDQLNYQTGSKVAGDFTLPTGDSTRLGVVFDGSKYWYQHRNWNEVSGLVPAVTYSAAVTSPPGSRRDGINNSGIRSEYVVYGGAGRNVPYESWVWHAFRMQMLAGFESQTDDQILMQLKQEPTYNFPYVTLQYRNGKYMLAIRVDGASGTQQTLWTDPNFATSTAHDWVLQMYLSETPGNAKLRAWRDGVQVVDHVGQFGHSEVTGTRQLRLGWYCFLTRDVTSKDRWARTGRHVLINDATGSTYSEPDIRALLESQ